MPSSDSSNYENVKFEIGKYSIFDGPKENLFKLDILIRSSLAKDTWFRDNYYFKLEAEVEEDKEGSNNLINVYDNYQLFKYKKLSTGSELRHQLFKSISKINEDLKDGEVSIVSKEFLNNFHRETRGLFRDENGNTLNNFLFYGGFITSCLTDVIILKDEDGNFSTSQYIEGVKNIFGEDYEDKGYSIQVISGLTVFSLHYPNSIYMNMIAVVLHLMVIMFGHWKEVTNLGNQSRGYDTHYHNTPGIQEK
ncbi:hypothetical protein ACTA71_011871 [Dictyostelium dimigraforme]